ncbi:YbjN domain-containing protein [Sphingomicrobium marinum]|uniref:YbjN domain-containing protein n=1 Tax=Sphingomicrobium marinum TaxID=1227950 RepID=UPI002240511E|nr:YbjN domain-containing protein [Sphingomicrobium marinum]
MILSLAAALALQAGASVDPADPATVIAALQERGYRAEMSQDGAGDPMVLSSDSGINFAVIFYGCEENANCKTLQLAATYGFDGGKRPGADVLHEFDRAHRYTRTYLDEEGDPWIEMDVQVKDGPIEREEFDEALDIFLSNNGRFLELIDF